MIRSGFVSWLGAMSGMRMPQARRRKAADRPGSNMEVLEVRQLMTADLDDQIREAAQLGSATQ